MPVFHAAAAVFVHVPKTGGQSIEAVFGCAEPDEAAAYGLFGDRDLLHLTAAEIRAGMPVEFGRYFKFAFVRNPWDRMVSEYAYTAGRPWYLPPADDDSFPAFVRRAAAADPTGMTHAAYAHLRPQHEYLFAGGRLLVDFVGRFEAYDRHFKAVCRILGRDAIEPPRVNTSDHRPYASYYDRETADLVGRMYAKDADLFRYKKPV